MVIEYKVNGGKGGRIDGNSSQKVLSDSTGEEVTAVADNGYVFMSWSDLSWKLSRQDSVGNPRGDILGKNLEYIAYFEPIEKKFCYDYVLPINTPTIREVTLNRNTIQNTKFEIPSYEGYNFCGWYADKDYRVRITTETGRYTYGYAAFSLGTDTLYAKWQKQGEETDNHKILLVFVDEIETTLYSDVIERDINIHSKMSALDYEMSKWVAEMIYNLLNEWFKGKVVFEIDSYYTTSVVRDGFTGGTTSNGTTSYNLFATGVKEVFDLMYSYHNTITTAGVNDYEQNLFMGSGVADIKNACVYRENYFESHLGVPYHKYLEACKNGEKKLTETVVDTYLHELTHTAEMNYKDDDYHSLHVAIKYAIEHYRYANIMNTIKPCLLGEFVMDGVNCGVPLEYWHHKIPVATVCFIRAIDNKFDGGTIIFNGETVEPPEYLYGADYGYRFISYGGEMSIEAVAYKGFRFVKWSDGITTAVRHDRNVIAYFRVEAIFEKINK